MEKLKEPKKPSQPNKPKEPLPYKIVRQEVELDHWRDQDKTLLEVISQFKSYDQPLEDIKFDWKSNYRDGYDLYLYWENDEVNPNYNSELAAYKVKLEQYNEKMKKYKLEMKIYKEEMKEYKAAFEIQEIENLKAKLAKLEAKTVINE